MSELIATNETSVSFAARDGARAHERDTEQAEEFHKHHVVSPRIPMLHCAARRVMSTGVNNPAARGLVLVRRAGTPWYAPSGVE